MIAEAILKALTEFDAFDYGLAFLFYYLYFLFNKSIKNE
jgi:hypothetical protein